MLSPQEVEKHVAKIREDGYSIVENAIEPEFADALAADLLRLVEQGNRPHEPKSQPGPLYALSWVCGSKPGGWAVG